MKLLEVNGAVRSLYGSLGVKGLISPFRVRLRMQKCLQPPASLNKIYTGLHLLPVLCVTRGDGSDAFPCAGSRRPAGY